MSWFSIFCCCCCCCSVAVNLCVYVFFVVFGIVFPISWFANCEGSWVSWLSAFRRFLWASKKLEIVPCISHVSPIDLNHTTKQEHNRMNQTWCILWTGGKSQESKTLALVCWGWKEVFTTSSIWTDFDHTKHRWSINHDSIRDGSILCGQGRWY